MHEELQGVILYDELKTLLKNYVKKEKMFLRSLKAGLRYDLINEEVFKFLQSLKVLSESEDETKEGLDLKRDILGKAILKKDIIDDQGQEMSAEVVEFEPLMDHLFMKFQIRCPPMKVQSDLKLILAISPTLPDFLLV